MKYKYWINAGALQRKRIRLLLEQIGIKFLEDKSLINSIFYILDCTEEQIETITELLESS